MEDWKGNNTTRDEQEKTGSITLLNFQTNETLYTREIRKMNEFEERAKYSQTQRRV